MPRSGSSATWTASTSAMCSILDPTPDGGILRPRSVGIADGERGAVVDVGGAARRVAVEHVGRSDVALALLVDVVATLDGEAVLPVLGPHEQLRAEVGLAEDVPLPAQPRLVHVLVGRVVVDGLERAVSRRVDG